MKYKNLVVVDTQYSLLIYFLLNGKKDTYFLLGDSLNYKFGNKIYNFRKLRFVPGRIKNIIGEFYELLVLKKLLKEIAPEKIWGHDHIRLGNKLSKFCNFILLEDGSMNYLVRKEINEISIYRNFLNKIFYTNLKIMGFSDNVTKIYLTGLAKIPREIENKVEIINLKKLWLQKNEKEKEEITEIFLGEKYKEILKKIEKKEIILFTQPIEEIENIKEKEKIEIYRKIISKYPKEKLLIKTHPREKTDYSKYFKNIEIIEEKFPSEFFNFYNIDIKKTVTLFSTAALNFSKDVEIDFYGTEVHPVLLKYVGNCDKIFKRNCYLD